MLRLVLTQTKRTAKQWLDKKAASISAESVIKSVHAETDISSGYFFAIVVANLIALCGLLTNSLAVIIGAMLISPLMGPILSTGFAFVTGELAEKHGIPKDRISKTIGRKGENVLPSVKISIIPEESSPNRPSPGPTGRKND